MDTNTTKQDDTKQADKPSVKSFHSKSYMLGYIRLDSLEATTMGQPIKDLQSLFLTANRLVGSDAYVESMKTDNTGLAIWQGTSGEDAEVIHFMFPWGWEACDIHVLKDRIQQMWDMDENGHPIPTHQPLIPENTENQKQTEHTPQQKEHTMLKIKDNDEDMRSSPEQFKLEVIRAAQHMKVTLSMDFTNEQVDMLDKNVQFILSADWFKELVGNERWAETAAFDIAKGLAHIGMDAEKYPFTDRLEWLRSVLDTGRADQISERYSKKDTNAVILSMLLNYLSIEAESSKLMEYFPMKTISEHRMHHALVQQAVVNANVFLLRLVSSVIDAPTNPDHTLKSLKSLPQDTQVNMYRAGINTAMDNIRSAMVEFRMLWLNANVKYSPAQLAASRSEFDKGTDAIKERYIMTRITPIDFKIDPAFNDVLLNQYHGETATKRPKP